MSDTTCAVPQRPVKCLVCGHYCRAESEHCPRCGMAFDAVGPESTSTLGERQVQIPIEHQRNTLFLPTASAILKFSPSGICISLVLTQSVMLGRSHGIVSHDFLDLTDFGAQELGVSRHHCLLRRLSKSLLVTDLGSTNGTYLNDELLPPRQDRVLAHGDDLILGRLHLVVLFNTLQKNRQGT